jgi:hypothetical protein
VFAKCGTGGVPQKRVTPVTRYSMFPTLYRNIGGSTLYIYPLYLSSYREYI